MTRSGLRRLGILLAAVASTVVLFATMPAPAAAAPVLPAEAVPDAVAPVAATPLTIASFNIRCANCSTSMRVNGREKKWTVRRAKVVAQIKAEAPDVIGVQEASPGVLKGSKRSQFDDLTARLGAPYKLTNSYRYNCRKSNSYKNCKKVDRGASADSRIIYNTERLTLLDQGSRQLDKEKATSGPRFVAWAIFEDKLDGRTFLFATTHLEPGQSKAKRAVRKKQANLIVAELRKQNPDNLPVILTGDFGATKLTAANPAYTAIMKSGLVTDPTGNSHKKRSTSASTVGTLINAKYDTLNDFKARPVTHKGFALGAWLDYILTSEGIQMLEFEVVMNLTASGKFSGTIPSDHNMIRATILLP